MDAVLENAVETALGVLPESVRPLSGGCVGEVYLVEAGGERVVVKLDRASTTGSLEIEGAMLSCLAERSDLPVPTVLHASPGALVMSYIENDGARSVDGERAAGATLAALHDVPGDAFGFERDTLIGSLDQPNAWHDEWATFYADRRLRPFADRAERRGALPPGTRASIDALCDRLPELIGGGRGPSLIHGDIWSGNVLWDRGSVVGWIDPAVHYADAEVELAFIELFSTFGPAFWEAYRDRRPQRPGWPRRRDIYQLQPLLVHAVLFGGGYGSSVRATLDRALR